MFNTEQIVQIVKPKDDQEIKAKPSVKYAEGVINLTDSLKNTTTVKQA